MPPRFPKGRVLRTAAIAVLLIGVCTLGVGIRWRIVERLDTYYGGMLYTRESAFYFHFANVLSEGRAFDGGVSFSAQHPDGFDVERDHNFAKGKTTACAYRLLAPGSASFEKFARRFDAAFFCLGLVPFFLLLRVLSRNDWFALLGTCLYAVCIPALQRSTGAGFDMETFSIPLLIAHLWLFVEALKRDRLWISLVSGVVLGTAIAGWDFCQFYLLLLALFALLSVLAIPRWEQLLRHCSSLLPGLILAGVLSAYLRSHHFLTSYGMILLYPLSLAGLLFPGKGRKKLYIAAGVVVVSLTLAFCTFVFSDYSRVYSHVGQKFSSKLKHLNSKPADPGKLTFTERIEWTPPFHSATEEYGGDYPLIQMLRYAVPAAVPLILFVIGFVRRKRDATDALIMYNMLAFAGLYMLFVRLKVLLVLFAILAFGMGWRYLREMPGRMRHVSQAAWGAFLGCLLIFEILQIVPVEKGLWRYQPVSRDHMTALRGVVKAVEEGTAENSVVLADYATSPVILAYTGRSVILHPKFESPEIRKRVEEYYTALFDRDEQAIHRLCSTYGADYFLFTYDVSNTEKGDSGWVFSPKYMANATQRGFTPYGFRWMVADDQRVAYFRPIPDWTVLSLDSRRNRYVVRYKLYEVVSEDDMQMARQHLLLGATYLQDYHDYGRRSDLEDAKEELHAGIKLFPGLPPEAYTHLGTVYRELGDEEEANRYYTWAVSLVKEGRE